MRTVFVDVDTQLDFLFPAGALYVPGAERILPALGQLNRYAEAHGIPLLSTADAHAENDPEFAAWPPHCVAGTLGQRKPAATLLENRAVIPNREVSTAFDRASQYIVEKQTIDVFETQTVRRVLDLLCADRYVVYGVVTEICVISAVRGLLESGKQVVVVADAIQALSAAKAAQALEEILGVGGSITTTSEILAA
jgi:nicotinamidase/pyrazinamidase